MSYLKELGNKAFGSRLKNLSDTLMQDVLRIYREAHVEFEPRWFTMIQLLKARKSIPITSIASELEISHPAVVQVVNILEKKKFIVSTKDNKDQRRRLISLSDKGEEIAESLMDVWEDIYEATTELLSESDPAFLEHLALVEKAYKKKSLHNRVLDRVRDRMSGELSFMTYHPDYQKIFQDLNLAWLEELLDISEYDRKVLADPGKEILQRSGMVFLARYKAEIIGSFVLHTVNNRACELSKFCLHKNYRGWGLGRHMLKFALRKAKEQGYHSVLLYTHPRLEIATSIYRQAGFQEINGYAGLSDPTGRCSILMKLELNP